MTDPTSHIRAGVYAITCIPLQKTYIGAATDVRNRIQGHKARLRSGVHPIEALQADFNQYGENAFDFAITVLYEHVSDARKHEDRILSDIPSDALIYNTRLPRPPKQVLKKDSPLPMITLLNLARANFKTDEALAKAIRVNISTITRIRKGRHKQHAGTITKLIKAINA
jgi:hypothetical protein